MSFVDKIRKGGEVAIKWKIPDFFSQRNKIHSPVFIFNESQWCLKLWPSAKLWFTDDPYVVLYLMRKDNGPLKTIYCTVIINGVEFREEKYQFSRLLKKHPTFLQRSRLKTVMTSTSPPETVLRITFVLRSLEPSSVKGVRKLQQSLLSMLESGEDSDLLIKVQGKEYPAHRGILRARSSVFKSMFSHGMVEKQSGVVTIEDCDPDTFSDFLVHMYSGSCAHISSENVYSLYHAADKYDVSELKVECINFMKRELSIACICDVIMLAVKYDEAELMKWATKYFCDNALSIVKTDEWKTFLEENWTVGTELIIKTLSQEVPSTMNLKSAANSSVKGVRKLQESLLSILESGEDSDILLKVQGKEYPAHRGILRARSPVFKSMLNHGMVEKQSGVVTIEDCDPDTFCDFLVHMYSGSCAHISSENVYSLYQVADKYGISELKVECVNFMKRKLTVSCICDVIILAVKYEEAELMKCATKYFCDNSLAILKTDEWKTLLEENWTVGNELIMKALSQQVPFIVNAKSKWKQFCTFLF